MTLFWIVGIAINLTLFGALVWWAVRNWRRAGGPTPARPDLPRAEPGPAPGRGEDGAR